MIEAIRQRMTVQPGGRLALQSAELHDGDSVEVIVMTERVPEAATASRLSALNELRSRLNLNAMDAEKWIDTIRAERSAFPRPIERQ